MKQPGFPQDFLTEYYSARSYQSDFCIVLGYNLLTWRINGLIVLHKLINVSIQHYAEMAQ